MKICLLILNIICSFICFSQKKQVSHEIVQKWKRVQAGKLANNGKYLLYVINNYSRTEEEKLIIQSTSSNWKIELRNYDYSFQFTADSRKAISKAGKDTMAIIALGSEEIEYLPNVASFKLPKQDHGEWLAYHLKNNTTDLVVRNIKRKKEWTFRNIKNYLFTEDGNGLLLGRGDADQKQELVWVDVGNNLKEYIIWTGENTDNYIFNSDFTMLAFKAGNSIWTYRKGESKPVKIVDDRIPELEGQFSIGELIEFNRNNNSIIFSLKELPKKLSKPGRVSVDVWSYTDPKLQSNQLWELKPYSWLDNPEPRKLTLVHLEDQKIIRLEHANEETIGPIGNYALVAAKKGGRNDLEWNWNSAARADIELMSVKDGSQKKILNDKVYVGYYPSTFMLTPDEKYIVYFDAGHQNYFSYNIRTGETKCLTKEIQTTWTSYLHGDEPDARYRICGNGGFINDGKYIILYSQHDIFQVDVSGNTPPMNLTNNYGSRNNITLRLAIAYSFMKPGDKWILNAFDQNTHNNGFYSITAENKKDPEFLTMQPCIFMGPFESSKASRNPIVKAENADAYLVVKETASSSPNLFFTSDFKTFKPVSDNYPEKTYNWLTSELHTWKALNGDSIKGILYKPGNFNPQKKYPVIFYYYEKLSEGLHSFIELEYSSGSLNIPYFVSNDYLVFVPDIPKIMGHPGPSAVNAVVSAANYLSGKSYVDSTRLGLQGHSFGGFETNYIITHSNKFAAAVPAASMTDFISCYGSIFWLRDGSSRQRQYEIYHDGIGASMWDRPDLYIENSPVLYAHNVTTPVLMMNNKKDDDVPFAQGVEFFTALRRLGKKVWMLQYDEGMHSLWEEADAKDFTIRVLQFFDHYLKGKPAPVWMTRGIPARDKGIKDGFEYDTEVKTPGEGLLLPEEKQKVDSFKYRKPFTITIP